MSEKGDNGLVKVLKALRYVATSQIPGSVYKAGMRHKRDSEREKRITLISEGSEVQEPDSKREISDRFCYIANDLATNVGIPIAALSYKLDLGPEAYAVAGLGMGVRLFWYAMHSTVADAHRDQSASLEAKLPEHLTARGLELVPDEDQGDLGYPVIQGDLSLVDTK